MTVSIPYLQDKEEHHGTIGNTRKLAPVIGIVGVIVLLKGRKSMLRIRGF
jgi:hypothetical protein